MQRVSLLIHTYIRTYICINMSVFCAIDSCSWKSYFPYLYLLFLEQENNFLNSMYLITMSLSFTKMVCLLFCLHLFMINNIMFCQFTHNCGCYINNKNTQFNLRRLRHAMRQLLFLILPLVFIQLLIPSLHERAWTLSCSLFFLTPQTQNSFM